MEEIGVAALVTSGVPSDRIKNPLSASRSTLALLAGLSVLVFPAVV